MLTTCLRLLFFFLFPIFAYAQTAPGVTLVEMKIGSMSKPQASLNAYGNIFQTESAYINKINADGGIKGRQLKLITSDSAQQLLNQDQVFLIFGSVVTPTTNFALRFLNQNKMPQLFVSAASTDYYQPKRNPWTISVLPSYYLEGKAYAKYIRDHIPNPKIGILYTNNEYGKMYVQAFNEVFGTKALQTIIKQTPITSGTPNVVSELAKMAHNGANVLIYNPPPEYAVEGLRAIKNMNWFPIIFVSSSIASKDMYLQKVGFNNVQGIFTATPFKDPLAPELQSDPDVQEFKSFMAQYYPDGPLDRVSVIGYVAGKLLEYVLTQAGDNLTRENVMNIAKNLNIPGENIGMLYPNISIKTSPQKTELYSGLQLLKFQGSDWQPNLLIPLSQ